MLKQIRTTLKNTILYSVGNLSVKLIGFILLPLYSKHFTVSEYGLLALFEVTSDFLIAISSFGIDNGLRRWYWDKDQINSQKSLFFTFYSFSLVSTFLFCILSYFLLGHFRTEIFNTNISSTLLQIFLFSIFIKIAATKILLLMRNKQEALQQTKYLLSYLVITFILSVSFIVIFHLGIECIFYAQSLSFIILFIRLLPYLNENIEPFFNRKLLKEMLTFSIPLALSGILSLVLTLGDRFIIKHYLTLADVGNYSVAYKISSLTRLIIVASFNQAFVYVFYRQMFSESNRRFFTKVYSYYTMVAIYFSLFLAIFAEDIIKLLTVNKDYQHSIDIIPLLCLGIVLSGSRQILTLPLSKHKKTAVISSYLVIAAVLNIGSNILLIPLLGNSGAAYSTVLSQFFLTVVFYLYSRKLDRINFEWKRLIWTYCIGLGVYFISHFLPIEQMWLRLLVKLIICTGFPFYFYFLHLYEPIELQRMNEFWQKWRHTSLWKEYIKEIRMD